MEAVLALVLVLVLVLAVSRGALTVRGTEDSKSALLMSARIWGVGVEGTRWIKE